jgi:PAS domain S-box-containing protein
MAKRKIYPGDPDDLRQKADDKIRNTTGRSPNNLTDLTGNQILIHELKVHQVELELQNEELLKVRAELESSLENYTSLYEFAPVGYFVFDASGTIRSVNLTGTSLLGIERSRVIKRQFRSFVAAEHRSVFDAFLKKVFTEKSENACDLKLAREDNQLFFAHIQAVVSENTEECRATAIDITERKRAEQESCLHSEIIKNVAEGIYLIRLADTSIVYANPRFENMFGYEPGEMIGKDVSIVNAPTDKTPEETKRTIMDILTKTGEWHGEVENIRKDGTRFWCYANVSFVDHPEYGKVIISVHSDITKEKQTETALMHTYGLLDAISEGSTDAIYVKDIRGRYLLFNKEAARITGNKEEVIGKDDYFLFPADEAETLMAADRQVMERGQVTTYEDVVTTIDGIMTYLSTKGPVYDEKGRLIGLFGISRNITERKKAEEMIEHSLLEKTVMLQEIHHRVKNNLAVIVSLLGLQARGIADESVRARFDESRNRVYTMALIHETLYHSTDLAHIDFKEYLKDLVGRISDTYKQHDVVFSVDMESLALDVNVGIPCGLIVNELVSNSLKHAFPEGRKGTVKLGININSEGDHVLFVEDNGVGLPADIDFQNTTTLGLELVTGLARQIRGKIELSREGGTRFVLTFRGAPDIGETKNG